jgi:dienelactone hydrolase
MKGELVKVITSDGLELKGFFSDQKSDLAVFQSHGTAGDFYTHEFVEVEGAKLAKEKVSFLTANNRGHDVYADIRRHKNGKVEWTQIGGGFEKFEDCIFDIDAWINFLIKKGVKKIVLQGHSLGPNKNIYYQSIKNNKYVKGFIHLSPQNDAGLMKLKLGNKKYQKVNLMIEDMIKNHQNLEMLSKELQELCPISTQAYSGYFIENGIGNLFPYHNPSNTNWKIFSAIKELQLLVFGREDPYIKPSIDKAIQVFKSKINKSSQLESNIIIGASHSYLGYEKELVKIIFDWIKENYL